MRRRIKAPRHFADDWHRRDYDALIEKHSDARIWMRAQGRIVRERPPAVPMLLQPPQRLLRAI